MRSARRALACALCAVVLLGCRPPQSVPPAPAASASAALAQTATGTPSSTPSATAAASPTAAATAAPAIAPDPCVATAAKSGTKLPATHAPEGVTVKATGPLSDDFRYLLKFGPAADQMLLADMRAHEVKEVATFRHDPVPGRSGVDAYPGAASTDGRTLVWGRYLNGTTGGQFYLIKPVTGDVELIYETTDVTDGPNLSPSGASVATWLPAAGGVFAISVPNRTIRRVFSAENVNLGVLSWSANDRWLAIALGLPGGTAVAIIDVCGPEARFDVTTRSLVAGRGYVILGVFDADLSTPARPFLTWDTVPRSPTKIVQVDPATGATQTVYEPTAKDAGLRLAAWSSWRDDILTEEYTFGPGNAGNAIWVRTPSGLQTRIRAATYEIGDAWWSPDGIYIYALAFRARRAVIIDAAHNTTIASFCYLDPCQ